MIVYLGSTVGTRNSVLGDFVRRLTAILAADVAGYSRLMGGPVPPARSRFPLSYSAFFRAFRKPTMRRLRPRNADRKRRLARANFHPRPNQGELSGDLPLRY